MFKGMFNTPLMVGAHSLLAAGLVWATARLDKQKYTQVSQGYPPGITPGIPAHARQGYPPAGLVRATARLDKQKYTRESPARLGLDAIK
eukprot:227477-Pyramimonas_sp.AAC.1